VNPSRSSPAAARPSLESSAPATGFLRSWTRFWFTPVDPIGLHGIRLLAGLVFLVWLLPYAGHLESFFSLQGWFDQKAYAEVAKMPDRPPQSFSWSALYLLGSDPLVLQAAFWVSVGVLVLFTLGICPRLTAVLTWVIVISFTANPAIDHDADCLMSILAFYLMIGYLLLGQRSGDQSLLARLVGPRSTWFLGGSPSEGEIGARPSLGANLAVRLLQVHFAIVIVTSGLHKLQFGDWWSGVAFWYYLYPPFETTMAQAREHAGDPDAYLTVLSLAAYLTLAWQIGFPLFAWRPRWRTVLLAGAVVGWLGTALLYHMPLVGPIMLVGCLSYLTPVQWRRTLAFLGRHSGLRRLTGNGDNLGSAAALLEVKRVESTSLVTVGRS
jgi:hypothetical protein